ncbi:MAG TPA: ComEC/Rec2 family competence protein [Candidatus Saccharimonadales bacterium]|nr:ComEC/Rec2 family competence protein [Candidatus Saccharimonadales bacterium]
MERFLRHRFRRPTLAAIACAAFLLGVSAAGAGRFSLPHLFVFLGVVGLLRARRQDVWVLIALAWLGFCLGSWRGQAYAQRVHTYDGLFKKKAVFVGVAQADAVYGARTQLTFTASSLQVLSPVREPLIGVVSVSGFGVPMVYRGDVVQMSGALYPTLGGNQAKLSFANLQVIAHGGSWLDTVRRHFVAGVESALPEPAASFGLGLLIGQRSTLPSDVSQQLTMVGLTHIIAVSGYNLTIILQVVRRLTAGRSKYQALVLFVTLIGGFVLLVGSSPSIVRAAIVSLLSIAAWYYGHEIKPLTLLLLAAAITAYANPLYVWGNVSWYLSFLAFAGVMLLAPLVMKRFLGTASPHILLSVLVESLCAELLTLPYILHIFGQMSLVALVANVLVVALVPLAMLFTLAAGLAGTFAAAFAGWVAWPARLLLTYMLDMAAALSRIPHAFLQNIGFSLGEMFAAYAAVAIFGLTLHRRAKRGIITDKKAEETKGV